MDPSSFLKSLEILPDLNDQEISFLASKAQWIDMNHPRPSSSGVRSAVSSGFVYEGEVKVMIPAVGATGKAARPLSGAPCSARCRS